MIINVFFSILITLSLVTKSLAEPVIINKKKVEFMLSIKHIGREVRKADLKDIVSDEAFTSIWQIFNERLSQISESNRFPGSFRSAWKFNQVTNKTKLGFNSEKSDIFEVLSQICSESKLTVVISSEGFIVIPNFIKMDLNEYEEVEKFVYFERFK